MSANLIIAVNRKNGELKAEAKALKRKVAELEGHLAASHAETWGELESTVEDVREEVGVENEQLQARVAELEELLVRLGLRDVVPGITAEYPPDQLKDWGMEPLKRVMAKHKELMSLRERVAALVGLVDELVPLIGAQYDVPDLRELADELTGDVKDESKDGGA